MLFFKGVPGAPTHRRQELLMQFDDLIEQRLLGLYEKTREQRMPFGGRKTPERLYVIPFGHERQMMNQLGIVLAQINLPSDKVVRELMAGKVAENDSSTGGRGIFLELKERGADSVRRN